MIHCFVLPWCLILFCWLCFSYKASTDLLHGSVGAEVGLMLGARKCSERRWLGDCASAHPIAGEGVCMHRLELLYWSASVARSVWGVEVKRGGGNLKWFVFQRRSQWTSSCEVMGSGNRQLSCHSTVVARMSILALQETCVGFEMHYL